MKLISRLHVELLLLICFITLPIISRKAAVTVNGLMVCCTWTNTLLRNEGVPTVHTSLCLWGQAFGEVNIHTSVIFQVYCWNATGRIFQSVTCSVIWRIFEANLTLFTVFVLSMWLTVWRQGINVRTRKKNEFIYSSQAQKLGRLIVSKTQGTQRWTALLRDMLWSIIQPLFNSSNLSLLLFFFSHHDWCSLSLIGSKNY